MRSQIDESVFLICRCFFPICSAFFGGGLCFEHLQHVCCQIDESVFLICMCIFYLQHVSFLGSVVSICSLCVVKLTKVFSQFAGVFFYLQRVSYLGCVVSNCSLCVVKLRKLFP